MTIRAALKFGTLKLKESTSPALDAEVLLSHVLDQPKEYLLTNPEKALTIKQEKQFKILVTRRENFYPVAYLTKKKEFFGHELYVNPNVLVPRPETEELVDMVLKIARPGDKILDIGTGSGAIVISLAKNLPPGKFFASDVSILALKVAKRNAKTHQVKITFKQGSLLKPWADKKFDIIVANLPYLAKETDASTKHEPRLALIAKKEGLAVIEQLLIQANGIPKIFLEIGHDHGPKIKNLAKKYLPDHETKIFKDLSGRVRFAVLTQD